MARPVLVLVSSRPNPPLMELRRRLEAVEQALDRECQIVRELYSDAAAAEANVYELSQERSRLLIQIGQEDSGD